MASSSAPALLIKKLSDKARLPTRGSAFAAGYDLFAARATTIPARGKALVDTDISMSLPAGTCKYPYHPAPTPDTVPHPTSLLGNPPQTKH
jgi:dUTPase